MKLGVNARLSSHVDPATAVNQGIAGNGELRARGLGRGADGRRATAGDIIITLHIDSRAGRNRMRAS